MIMGSIANAWEMGNQTTSPSHGWWLLYIPIKYNSECLGYLKRELNQLHTPIIYDKMSRLMKTHSRSHKAKVFPWGKTSKGLQKKGWMLREHSRPRHKETKFWKGWLKGAKKVLKMASEVLFIGFKGLETILERFSHFLDHCRRLLHI